MLQRIAGHCYVIILLQLPICSTLDSILLPVLITIVLFKVLSLISLFINMRYQNELLVRGHVYFLDVHRIKLHLLLVLATLMW